MRTWWTLYKYQEAALLYEWDDPATGQLIDFSSGWSFTFHLVSANKHFLEKTTGIIGAATSPNVAVQLAAGELAAASLLVPGLYVALLTARRVADSVDFVFRANDPPIVELLATPEVAT